MNTQEMIPNEKIDNKKTSPKIDHIPFKFKDTNQDQE